MMIQDKKKIQITIDRDLANSAEQVLSELGLNQTTAVTAFYKQVVLNQAIPFELRLDREKAAAQLKETIQQAKDAGLVNTIDLRDPKNMDDWLNDSDYDY
ncbi:MAG: type II toxin-antitoxin system RelB/DinJ family antitoxin [Micrococcaceae bacterium]